MAAPVPMVMVETVTHIYKYLGYDDSLIDVNTVFQDPRISRHDPNNCDLCFALGPAEGSVPAIQAAVLFPEYTSFRIKVDIEKVLHELPSESKTWPLPVESCSTSPNSLCLFLNHELAFRSSISRILLECNISKKPTHRNGVICVSKDVDLKDKESADLTQLRTLLAFESLCNVYSLLGCKVLTECSEDENCTNIKRIHVCYKQHCPEKHSKYSLILCGAVLDKASRTKATSVVARDYYRKKKVTFEEVAQGRAGPQDTSEHASALSEAEVAGELLWVKLHDNVSLDLSQDSHEAGVPRGATFLLYNLVRLSCIRKKFEQEVECGNYQKLPSIEAIDFGLLTQSEEWELLLLVLQFPSWLVNCVSPRGKVSLHWVLMGLDKLCRLFSVYYRRVRILTEPRPQLVPVMHARIYLLQCVEHVLEMGLSIFNIKPLNYM